MAARPIFDSDVPDKYQRLHAFVSGHVQGVGFRWYVIQRVRLHMPEVTGWIRNLRDGRIELIAEGPSEQIDQLIETLNLGPSGAEVSLVETEYDAPQGDLRGFDTIYDA